MAATIETPPEMMQVSSALSYRFSNLMYPAEALRAAGSGCNMNRCSTAVNGHKRLAHVGSAVMKAAVISDWYVSGAQRGQ